MIPIFLLILPDSLVLLFTANDQSLYGSIDVVERARRARAELAVDRAKLLVLPVVTRFEGRVEYELASYWLSKFEQELTPLYTEWSHRDVQVADLLNFTRIPYVAYWSFGEKLPVIEKGTKDTDDIGFSLETLAAFVAHQFAKSDLLVRNRDNFVAQAAKKDLRVRRPLNVFISHAREDVDLAETLKKHLTPLRRSKIINLWTDDQIRAGEKWDEQVDNLLKTADIVVLLVSADFLASDYAYSGPMQQLLERQEAGKAIVIPVLLRPVDLQYSPFSTLQTLPSDAKPITSWSNQDEAFTNVVQGLSQIIENAEDYIYVSFPE